MWWQQLPLGEAAGPAADGYLARLPPVFAPTQLKWAAGYLAGLLTTPGRKTVRAMAAHLAPAPGRASADPSQALHNFLARSPWSDRRLLAAVRADLCGRGLLADGAWAVHDLAMPKRGRQAVGVYRQFAARAGRKTPAQRAVFVTHVGPAGCFPVSVRLYLPAGWLRELADDRHEDVPPSARRPRTRGEVALELLDELLAEAGCRPRVVAADPGCTDVGDWAAELAGRGFVAAEDPEAVTAAAKVVDELYQHLGLADFAGRGWRGWHRHAALVLAAYALVVS